MSCRDKKWHKVALVFIHEPNFREKQFHGCGNGDYGKHFNSLFSVSREINPPEKSPTPDVNWPLSQGIWEEASESRGGNP
jgi:hypothetical protein